MAETTDRPIDRPTDRPERNDVYRGSVSEENCRGGTEVSVEITCGVEEKIMFEKTLTWP